MNIRCLIYAPHTFPAHSSHSSSSSSATTSSQSSYTILAFRGRTFLTRDVESLQGEEWEGGFEEGDCDL